MKISWMNRTDTTLGVKQFLLLKGVSQRLYSEVKQQPQAFYRNEQPITPAAQVAPGDQITVVFPPERPDPQLASSLHPLEVIYEDAHWLVINKPAGLTSVPGPSNRTDTVVNRVKGRLEQAGSENLRPHLVTRLDRFTSGIMLIAKDRLANNYATQQLADRTFHKEYLAIVSGRLTNQHDVITLPLGRRPGEIARAVLTTGQPAQTEYWVEQQTATATVVRVQLQTGRTHQIRAHFAALGHPLLGDQLYGGPMHAGMDRQALHALRIEWFDPFCQQLRKFTAPLPDDMLNYQ
ncbi:Ribosomal large subunit pseudouridine synthase D [Fructilactobacillus florum 8D]|uniref:Pseudouridine synthase n=1 Tax=Fructilactobacillus florum 8D TaxID=1221538 RepID=W9EFA3_9LACO|nr:RluA family pseudouridine synthase [Fructilactobacillus florum]EKK20571.1 Ribosomal large subunit pseudouridine synthase D [Fructilactobacillus florum 2F]ETO40823.1 Ribosomal large subunit pseudouridine synthase D [Fructilactobacillus florum 8D]